MKFSEAWLREWVNPTVDSNTLAEQLTMAGLEVDGVEPVCGVFNGVIIGQVVECKQHPNADKLRVTKVDVGRESLLDIVCGAPNCRLGLKVACATIGAVLPGDFKIKAAKLRGEPSEGMLCSYAELGISDDQDGIIELPENAPIGADLRTYLQLDDHSIEISVTPNRADCLGIQGIARDVAAMHGLAVHEPEIKNIPATVNVSLPIDIEASQACPRYLGRVMTNINVQATTPIWMKEKLRRCGIRSIDAVVDVTNFVLLELGQPMHAFDLSKIDSGIIVRMAKENEPLTLLDGNEVKLSSDTLVIADHSKALAMAGIFGGKYSGVNTQTKDILLESAYFSPLAIAGRARRYGLHTDASHRYERGVDFDLQHKAMERATGLLLDICGGNAGELIDISTKETLPKQASINLRRSKLFALLGHAIEDDLVSNILSHLGCRVAPNTQGWQVVAPTWRFDLSIEEDLVEEIARVYGYNNIPNIPLCADLTITARPENDLSLKRVKDLLIDRGFQEAITYSFVDPKIQNLLHPHQEALILPSPISVEMSAMRLSLWTGLLAAVTYNQNRQQSRVRLFESGLRFIPAIDAELGVNQEMMLAGIITGNGSEEQWSVANKPIDFYDLKGDVEAILGLVGKQSEYKFIAQPHSSLHPGQSAAIYHNNQCVGHIGLIHPEIETKLGLNGRTVVFELLWESISRRALPETKEISKFPANRRDISIVVYENVATDDVLAECKKVGENQLVGVNLFDVYRGKGITDGCKSLAISLILQDTSRTLEEDEIAATVAKCVAALKERFQASLRD